jgi:hypothetical protein
VSLFDAQPLLSRALGPAAAAELGHRRVLDLLRIGAGGPVPPAEGAIAFVVVDGLLCRDATRMAGPGDVVAAIEDGWAASTSTHVAIVGPRFAALAASWPGAVEALVGAGRPRVIEPTAGGTPPERVLTLLWRLAGLWGAPDGTGMALSLALGADGLARLTGCALGEVQDAVSELAERGAADLSREGAWRLAGAVGAPARGDELRARAARQQAQARQLVSDYAVLSDRLGTELERSRRRRRQG